jgi:hypothetical protein
MENTIQSPNRGRGGLLLLLSIINFGVYIVSRVGFPIEVGNIESYIGRAIGAGLTLFLIPLPLTLIFMLLKRRKGITFIKIHAVMAIIVHVTSIVGGLYKTLSK